MNLHDKSCFIQHDRIFIFGEIKKVTAIIVMETEPREIDVVRVKMKTKNYLNKKEAIYTQKVRGREKKTKYIFYKKQITEKLIYLFVLWHEL